MKTADEMFFLLGYKKKEVIEYITGTDVIRYEHIDKYTIVYFNLKQKCFTASLIQKDYIKEYECYD